MAVKVLSTRRTYSETTSIVLIGARGTGKSSLATIAWSSFGLEVIDLQNIFQEKTGLTRLAFRRNNGTKACRDQEFAILRNVFEKHPVGCVIICFPDWLDETGLTLLKQYAASHPVIHINRKASAVQRYLSNLDPAKVIRVLELSNNAYRLCSNFEFYNLDEEEMTDSNHINSVQSTLSSLRMHDVMPQSLLLKGVEENFVRFVNRILLPTSPQNNPLPFEPPRSEYTYVLNLPLSQISSNKFKHSILDCGVDACQLELDTLSAKPYQSHLNTNAAEYISNAFALLRRFFAGPIIYHVKIPTASSEWETEYFDLLRHGLRLGADYLTVNLLWSRESISGLRSMSGSSRLIGDFHDANPDASGWSQTERMEMYMKATSLELDGVRLTQIATSIEDTYEAMSFAEKVKRSPDGGPFIIAYNEGSLGRPSQCLNRILTPVSVADLGFDHPEIGRNDPNNGLLTIGSATKALYSMYFFSSMNYYVVGVDVSYSLSPALHNASHQFFGMPHRFTARSIASLEELHLTVTEPHLGGVSIAQGYKMSVFPFVSAVSKHARRIGAMNTLIPIRSPWKNDETPPPQFWKDRNRAGPVLGLYGDNTDWVGMVNCILPKLSPANVINHRSTALVIGAGGMARAALYAMLQLDVRNIVIYNRTPAHARALASHFGSVDIPSTERPQKMAVGRRHQADPEGKRCQFHVLETPNDEWPTHLAQPTIVISCVPASTVVGQPGARFVLPEQWMRSRSGGVVVDLNYRPIVTPLLKQIRQQSHRGWIAVDGLENLSAQACVQFELFTGRKVPRNFMRLVALREYHTTKDDDVEAQDAVHSTLRQLDESS